MTLPAAIEKQALLPLLESLNRAIEDLLATGLSAASQATRQSLEMSFREASRMRLLRLGSTLRVAVEEIGRYADGSPDFSRRRYGFFLNRAWMLSRGLRRALEVDDAARWDRLTGHSGSRTLATLDVVTLGVVKRVVPNAFVAFELRMRVLAGDLPAGTAVVFSTVFPLKAGNDVPPEAYLHLPLPQKFRTVDLLSKQVVRLSPLLLSDDGRISLSRDTTLAVADPSFHGWEQFLRWDPAQALERLRRHPVSPFSLEVELQEELFLHEWTIGKPQEQPRERQLRYDVTSPIGPLRIHAGMADDSRPLRESLEALGCARRRPPLYGLLHYEMCRFTLEPLTVFQADGPEFLTLSNEKFDRAALVRALKFT